MVYIQEAEDFCTDYDVDIARSDSIAGAPLLISSSTDAAPDERPIASAATAANFGCSGTMTVVADAISNEFQDVYASWPLRWYVFQVVGNDGAGTAASTSLASTDISTCGAEPQAGRVVVTHIGEP